MGTGQCLGWGVSLVEDSLRQEIQALRAIVKQQAQQIAHLTTELGLLRVKVAEQTPFPRKQPARRIRISKSQLARLVKENQSTKTIARHFRVSQRTIYRRIREWGLKDIRSRGPKRRKRRAKKPRPILRKEGWVRVREYFEELDRHYRFVNIQYPVFRYINPRTLVCSNQKHDPPGRFSTVGIYSIALQSDVYFVNYTRIRYSEDPVPFEEIHAWIEQNGPDIVDQLFRNSSLTVERVVAYTFLDTTRDKPDEISYDEEAEK